MFPTTAESLFAKKALERLSSPEKLDTLLEVTRPGGWLALLCLGMLVAFILLWSICGILPTKVEGRGILLRGGSVRDIATGSGGRIVEIAVQPGDLVKSGQVIATLDQWSLTGRTADLRRTLLELEAEHQAQLAVEKETSEAAFSALTKERENRRSFNGDLGAQVNSLREKVANQEELRGKGLVTSSSVLASQSALYDAQERLAQNQVRLAQIATDEGELRGRLQQQTNLRLQTIDATRRELRGLERQLEESAHVVSLYSGRVLARMVDAGTVVGPGSRLVSLETMEAGLQAVVFIPAGDGKKVQPGMEVRISPSTVKKEEFGFMLGRVSAVSSFPATQDAMFRVLHNEALVKELSGGSAPLEVAVQLKADAATVSGFAWSSSQGPPVQIFSGTLCDTSIVVQRKRPISYVIPMIKETLGVE